MYLAFDAVTLNASSSKRHGSGEAQTVITIASFQDTPLAATGSADGLVVVSPTHTKNTHTSTY